MSNYTYGQRLRDRLLLALEKRGVLITDHLMPLYKVAGLVTKPNIFASSPKPRTFMPKDNNMTVLRFCEVSTGLLIYRIPPGKKILNTCV
jgi:hypothetical protein